MTPTRRTVRDLAVLAVLVPLSGVGLLAAAGPAQAASGITAPGDGVEFASDTTVRITATVDKNTGPAELRLKSPTRAAADVVDSASTSLTAGASLAYDFDTATCASFPAACSGRAEAPNGVWTVTLVSDGKAVDTRTFSLRIAPRAPRNVSARADGYRAVVLDWAKGDEPDLTGWTVYADGVGQAVPLGACSGTACSTTLTYSQDGTGRHTYALVAHRRVAPDSTATVDSPRSAEVTATLDAPPPPPPPSPPADGGSPPPAGGSSAGGSPPGSAGGGSAAPPPSSGGSGSAAPDGSAPTPASGSGAADRPVGIGTSKAPATLASRRAFALTFKAFAPKLGIPKLPPLPAAPAVAPLPDGTYGQTLGYKDVITTQKVPAPPSAARRVSAVVSSAFDSAQFTRFLAGALVLFLLAAHARRWLGSSHPSD